MEEMLGHFGGSAPTPAILRLYRHWAKGGWGIVITGNVAIDSTHLGMPFDMTLPPPPHRSPALLEAFRAYADAASGRDCGVPAERRPLVVVQLVHAGRQSMRGAGRAPWRPSLGPSPVPMAPSADLGAVGKALDWALFGPVQELSIAQIEDLVDRFASAAELCAKAGFDGVEIHGSHGYQLAAFLSPKTNLRTDKYGGDARGRARLLMEIVEETRKRVPKDFALGVKVSAPVARPA
jgi:2,4-dienoyl-CoA reductase-like NADH-dependent reductase (Old Yellow Enzyme family)